MAIYQVLNTGDYFPKGKYQRHWLLPGEPMYLGNGCTIHLRLNRRDGEQEPELYVQTIGKPEMTLPLASAHFDLRPWTPLYVIPRAAQLYASGDIWQVMLEFISLRRDGYMEIQQCAL